MCGIIGFIDTPNHRKELPKAFDLLEHRGTDSYGVIAEFKNSVKTAKGLTQQTLLASLAKISKSNFLLCHNRKSSVGGTTLPLAHPITSSNNQVSVIHNGTKKSLFTALVESKSDTEAIAEIISHHFKASKLLTALLEGAGVVFAKHHLTGKVLLSVDGERPLFINSSRTVISSEPIQSGEWSLISNQLTIFSSFLDLLKNVEVHTKSITLLKTDKISSKYCSACKKIHLQTDTGTRCFQCEILDIKPSYQSYSSYNNYDEYNYWGGQRRIFYTNNETYEMSNDENIWIKAKLTHRSYPKGKTLYHSGNESYKYIREIQLESITNPKIGSAYEFIGMGGNELQGILTCISGTTYTLKVTETQSVVAKTLTKEIETHPTLIIGNTYRFYDADINNIVPGKFLGLRDFAQKRYMFRMETAAGVKNHYSRVLPEKESLEKKFMFLALTFENEWICAYIKKKTNADNYLCINPPTGELFYASEIKRLPDVEEHDVIEVSEDNTYWEYATVEKVPPKSKRTPILAYCITTDELAKFPYYREAY